MNIRLAFFIALFFLLADTGELLAQSIRIINQSTQRPVVNAYVFNFNRSKVAVSNKEGVVELKEFSSSDTLIIQHSAFRQKQLSYRQAIEQGSVELESRSITLEEVFVSASKRRQDLSEIPQRITHIGEGEIAFNNPQTSADLLQSSGKVFMQKSQLGGGSPMIRGFAANSVLIAVDGIRMNNAIFRSGNLQNVISVDANALENTEVLFGPGSVIYGSDALGGVMNFQTLDPMLSFSDETLVDANAMARYSSANNEQTIHADLSLGYEQWGFVSSVTYSDFDDLRSGSAFYEDYPDFGKRREYIIREDGFDVLVPSRDVTIQRFSGYRQLNLMQKVRFKPNKRWDATYGFHYGTTSDIPRYDRLIEREQGDSGPLVNAEWYYGPQIWMMNTLNVDYFQPALLFDNATATFSQQWFQESRNDRDFTDVDLRNREENVDVYTANVDFDKRWGEEQELFYGLEGVFNYVSSDASTRNIETGLAAPTATRYPDRGSDYTQLAAYAKYRHNLSSSLTAVSGVRYSHVFLNARFSSDFYDFPFDRIKLNTGALNGSLGFTYRPVEDLQFNLNGSNGFRAPNVDDAAKVFDSEPGTVIVPNPGLKPEYSYNIDFSIIKDIRDVARIEINSYYTWLKDAMVRRDFRFNGQDSIRYDGTMSKVEAVVNAGEAYIYGASIGLSAELSSDIGFNSELTYTEGRDVSNDEPLRHVAPLFGLVSLTYQSVPVKVRMYTEFNAAKDISDFSPSERSKPHLYTVDGSPAWATLNLMGAYRINKEFRLQAGVENIFDKHYRPYSSGISAPGRNVRVTLRAQL